MITVQVRKSWVGESRGRDGVETRIDSVTSQQSSSLFPAGGSRGLDSPQPRVGVSQPCLGGFLYVRGHQRDNRHAGDCACLVSSCIPCLLCLSCSCFQREVESLGPRQAVLVRPVHSTLAGTSCDKAWVSMRWLGHLVSVLSPSATEGTKALTTAGFNSWDNCGGAGWFLHTSTHF